MFVPFILKTFVLPAGTKANLQCVPCNFNNDDEKAINFMNAQKKCFNNYSFLQFRMYDY